MENARDCKKIQRTVLILLFSCMFITFANIMVIPPILPSIIADLGVSGGLGGQLISVFSIMMGIFALIFGPISDRYGRKPLISIGLFTITIAMILCAIAPNFCLLLISRILAGICGGILLPSVLAYAGDFFPYERRNLAIGYIMSGFFLSQVIVAPGSAFIADLLNWRGIFFILSIISLLIGWAVFIWLPRLKPNLTTKESNLGSLYSSYLRILPNRSAQSAVIVTALIRASMMGLLAFFSIWVVATYGVTLKVISLIFLIGGIAGLGSAPLAGHTANKAGNGPVFICSSIGISIMILILPLITFNLLWLTVLFALINSISAFRIISLNTIMTELVPQARAALLSLNSSMGQIGTAFGAILGGLLYDRFGYFSVGITLSIATFISVILFVTQVRLPSVIFIRESEETL